MSHEFTREALYELVWSSPAVALGKQFGISDVAFSKACKKADIPMPPRGYWARLEAGKRCERTPLTPRGIGKLPFVRVGPEEPYDYRRAQEDKAVPERIEFHESIEDFQSRVEKLVGKVRLLASAKVSHRSIVKLLADDEKRDVPFNWQNFESPFEKRRLRIIDAIFNAIERRGGRAIALGGNPYRFTVHVGDRELRFAVEDVTHKRHDRDYGYRSSMPRDKSARDPMKLFVLDLWGYPEDLQKEWKDEPGLRLEDQLAEIVVALMVLAETSIRLGVERTRQSIIDGNAQRAADRIKQAEREERERLERIAKYERDSVDRLLKDSRNLRRANDIRSLVASARSSGTAAPTEELENWCAWALGHADRIDPVLSGSFLEREPLPDDLYGQEEPDHTTPVTIPPSLAEQRLTGDRPWPRMKWPR